MKKFQAMRVVATSTVFEFEARSLEHARALIESGPMENVGSKEGVTQTDIKSTDRSYVAEVSQKGDNHEG